MIELLVAQTVILAAILAVEVYRTFGDPGNVRWAWQQLVRRLRGRGR